MDHRTDDYEFLMKELSKCYSGAELPKHYLYSLDKSTKNLTLTILEKGLKSNMQDDESAFESWSLILRFYLHKYIKTITIDWVDLCENKENNRHYNRFVYRINKFIQTYDWVFSNKSIPRIPSILVCNCPTGAAADAERHVINSEGWLECKYVEKNNMHYDIMSHQFPIGIFHDKVSRDTYYTTGGKSAIDIWAINKNDFFIFELKKKGNKPLGILSEIMFYTNIVNDILSHRIQYQLDSKVRKALSKNYRGFRDFYNAYASGTIHRINAVLLADDFHPLIIQDLLDFINDSARLRYFQIKYSLKEVNI